MFAVSNWASSSAWAATASANRRRVRDRSVGASARQAGRAARAASTAASASAAVANRWRATSTSVAGLIRSRVSDELIAAHASERASGQTGGVADRSRYPLVAVTGRVAPVAENIRGEAFAAGQRYSRAVARAGAQPVIVPPVVESFDRLAEGLARFDALVLHGGGDVDPARYGERPAAEQLYGIVAEHDELEFRLVAAAIELDLPVLAICRGIQLLNVALGGSLNQDIGNEDHWHQHHALNVEPGSTVAKALGTERPQRCHSVHHQSLKLVAPALRVVGWADDGTVEAVELPDARFVVGVQWHPEDTAATDPVQQSIFDALVAAGRPG